MTKSINKYSLLVGFYDAPSIGAI